MPLLRFISWMTIKITKPLIAVAVGGTYCMVEARLSCNGCKLLFYGRFNEAVQALVMRHGINGGSSVGIAVFKAYIQASFIGDFRFCSFFFAECKIIINSAMKICNQLRGSRSFVRYERPNALYFPVKKVRRFRKTQRFRYNPCI